MNISAISKTLIAPIVLLGATACTNLKSGEKAKSEALQYLSATELLKAEEQAKNIPHQNDCSNNREILYWDSILTANKAKEAYQKGSQMYKDSLEGKDFEKTEYKMPLDTIINDGSNTILKNLRMQCAKYYTASEFNELRNNVPDDIGINLWLTDNYSPNRVHFWNLITRCGKQRKAFEEGMQAERNKTTGNKLDINLDNIK